MLGGWRLLESHGQYVTGGEAKVGEPMQIRGRFIQLWGEGYYELFAQGIAGTSDVFGGSVRQSNKTWLLGYCVEADVIPFGEPCEFALELTPYGDNMQPLVGVKPIRGKLMIRPAD